jgi:hypothetical protein
MFEQTLYLRDALSRLEEALADTPVALDHLTVIYPGDRPYPLADRVTVVPLAAIATGPPALEPEGLRGCHPRNAIRKRPSARRSSIRDVSVQMR